MVLSSAEIVAPIVYGAVKTLLSTAWAQRNAETGYTNAQLTLERARDRESHVDDRRSAAVQQLKDVQDKVLGRLTDSKLVKPYLAHVEALIGEAHASRTPRDFDLLDVRISQITAAW